METSGRGTAAPTSLRHIGILALLVLLLPGALSVSLVNGATSVLYDLFHGLAVVSFAAGALWVFRHETRSITVFPRDALLVLFVLLIPVSWLGNTMSFASLEPFALWLEALVFYFLLAAVYRDREEPARIERLLLLLGVCVALGFLLRDVLPAAARTILPLTPFHFDANSAATLIVPGFFIALHRLVYASTRADRIASLTLVVIFVIVFVRSDSRALWLGFTATTIFALLVYSRDTVHSAAAQAIGRVWTSRRLCQVMLGVFWVGIAIFLVTLPFWFPLAADFVGESIGGRLRRWANGMLMVYEFFPFGVGAGNWLDEYPRFRGLAAADPGGLLLPFNTMLELTAEGGILLIAAFVLLTSERLAGGDFRGRALFTKCSLFCLLVVSFFHISFHINTIVLLWAAVLLLAAERRGGPGAWSVRIPVRSIATVCVAVSCVVLTFKIVATYGSIRSAVIINHLEYINDRPAFAFGSKAADLPGPVRSYLENVDYRNATPETLPEGRFATGFVRNTYSVIGAREAEAGRCEAAEKWFDAALLRNPHDVRARTGLCECATDVGQWASARRHCAEAVDVAPREAAAHENQALVLQRERDWQGALEHLLEARRLVDNRIGDHQFGRPSIPLVSGYLLQRKRIEDRLGELYSTSPLEPDRADKARRIAESPEVHKSLAVFRGRVLFSSNDGGRYNLWQLDGDGTDPRLLSNDSLAPFRLSVSARTRTLYFVADRRGDYRYSLYAMNLFQKSPQRIAPTDTDASVADYAVSPDGRYLAYKEERGNRRRLIVRQVGNGDEVRIPRPAFDYSHPVWSDDGGLLAFVSGDRIVDVYSPTEREIVASTNFDSRVADLTFAPAGETLWVLERDIDETTRLNVLDAATGNNRVVDTGTRRLVSMHPAGARLLVREFDDDRYLMRSFDPATQTWREAGPRDGVAYAPVTDPHANTAYFLHIGAATPIQLLAVDLDTLAWRPVYRFSAHTADEAVPFSRIPPNESGGATYYLYEPEGGAPGAPVVVWLHGSSSSFSPRWHKYAQYFSNAGFAFAALNFSGSTGLARPDLELAELRALQAEQVRLLVKELRARERYRDSPVVALGVSYGTLLADFTLSRDPGLFDAVIEYSPVRVSSNVPARLPHLVFAGANDAYADIDEIRKAFSEPPPHRSLRIFSDEGHDLRHQEHIVERLEATVAFIESLPGRAPR